MNTLDEKTEDKEARKLSPIQRFLCICAGVDKGILQQCPTEWNKYTGIGATILFTGVLASLSGGYALYTIFRDGDLSSIDTTAIPYAIGFGLLWGLIIFNLDRFIVSTFHKTDKGNKYQRFGSELLQASPRIVLAIIIAIVISKPIEVKIFESRLEEQIKLNEIASKKAKIDDFNAIYQVDKKEGIVNALDTTITKLQQELSSDPQNVVNLINNDLAKANSALVTTRTTNTPKINQHRQNITTIRQNQSHYRDVKDSLGNVIDRRLTADANQKIRNENNAIGELNGEIKEKENAVEKINKQIDEARIEHKKLKSKEIADRKTEKDSATVTLTTATNNADSESEKANKTSERAFTNNFISQLEALGDLTNSDTTMKYVSLFLTLLFLTIELAPILTKLITRRGPYDEILDAEEHLKKIEAKETISRINSEVNELLKQTDEIAKLSADIKMQSVKNKLDAELANNKLILDKIAEYQQELALSAIEKWYEDEKAKIDTSNIKSTSK